MHNSCFIQLKKLLILSQLDFIVISPLYILATKQRTWYQLLEEQVRQCSYDHSINSRHLPLQKLALNPSPSGT